MLVIHGFIVMLLVDFGEYKRLYHKHNLASETKVPNL
jgi:hypothetical protein